MSFAEVKDQVIVMSPQERRELQALLLALEEGNAPEHRRKMTEKIDDNAPENWVSYEEFKSEMQKLDASEA